MQVYVDKLKQLTTLTAVAEVSKRKRKGCWITVIRALEKNMTEKVQQAYVLVGNRVTVKELFNFHSCSKYIFTPILQQG
jgi:hypothetical protein